MCTIAQRKSLQRSLFLLVNIKEESDIFVKPLIIFQIRESMTAERVEALAEIIKDGINNGCLIIDNSVNILSFDKDGNLVYVTPRENHIEII